MGTAQAPSQPIPGKESPVVVSGVGAEVKYAAEAIGTPAFAAGLVATGGAALMGMFAWPTMWVYPVAPVIAGAATGLTFLALKPDDK
jgi:aquaporin Z